MFTVPLRVRYGECDPQGIVFNAHYLAYCDLALTELWRESVGSYEVMLDLGVDLVVGEATLRYQAPARFDDELEIEVTVTRLGTTGMTTRFDIRRGDELLIEAEMRHVFVDAASQTKTPIPDWVRDGLQVAL